MNRITATLNLFIITGIFFISTAAVDPDFHCYLLFGQSNMAGGCNGAYAKPESIDNQPADCKTTSRVQVLAFTDCSRKSTPCNSQQLERQHDKWYTAFPPYHNCDEGIGPADYFGKTLLDSISENISIGFIPCAISGVDIDFYRKNITSSRRNEFKIPPDNHWGGAYEWMLGRCKLAQQRGVIKGILFHQGESDNNNSAWVDKVAEIVKDLRKDLNLGEEVPFLAGELLRTGGCSAHNAQVAKIPDAIPNASVISSKDLVVRLGDTWNLHFSCESVRTFGKRYAETFLNMVDNEFVPRKNSGTTSVPKTLSRKVTASDILSGNITACTINGRVIKSSESHFGLKKQLQGIYIISSETSRSVNHITVVPFIR